MAAARAMARAGLAVVVLERETPGWGASSRNGGFVLPGFKRTLPAIVRQWGADVARRLFAESLESIDHLEALIADEAIECRFRRAGSLTVAESALQVKALKAEQEGLLRIAGHPTQFIQRDALPGEIGSARFCGGLLDPAAGSVQPARLMAGLLRSALQVGATVRGGTEAQKLEPVSPGFRVHTNRGPITADRLIVATNGYSGPVAPAVQRRIISIGSHIIATPPLDPALCRRLMPGDRVVSDSRNLLHYFRLSSDRRLVFGGRAAWRPDRTGADAEAAAILRRDMVQVFPELEGTPVERAWSGNVAFTRDQMPHLTRLDGAFVAGGYCGHGVAMAIYLGHRIGRHLVDGSELPMLASLAFPAIPFYRGHPWFLPAVGAWYRMLDWVRSPS